MKNILFHFYDPAVDKSGAEVLLAEIPKGVSNKHELLRLLAERLSFPDYFGFNWDALDECLSDLSWLQYRAVLIHHEDLPLASNPKEAHNYLAVLDGVLREPDRITVLVSFPESAKKDIEKLLQ